jgi:hypothetical protein
MPGTDTLFDAHQWPEQPLVQAGKLDSGAMTVLV